MNFGSGNLASGDFREGVDMEGLTNGTQLDRFRIAADGNDHIFNYASKIIIPKNNSFFLSAGVGGIAIEVSILLYYRQST